MFSGIVQRLAPVQKIIALSPQDRRLHIPVDEAFVQGLTLGASVAIDGVCLTLVELAPEKVCVFDVIAETLKRTTLKELKEGQMVNLERSLRLGDEIGGHLMSGHIFECAEIIESRKAGVHKILELKATRFVGDFLFEKGFVGLDGASLTLVDVRPTEKAVIFSVHLIPETQQRTTLGFKSKHDKVNLEIDPQIQAIVKTTQSFLQRHNG